LARTPEQDDVFLREVDDAVREDRLADFARRYGPVVVGVVVLALAAFAVWLWYGEHQANQAGEQGELYVQALDRVEGGNPAGAADALGELSDEGSPAYAAAARFTRANVAQKAGDTKRAVAMLGAIAGDSDVPQSYRDLATLRRTGIEFDTLKPDAIIARLKPLTDPASPWFASAAEMTAIAHLRKGERSEAGRIYADIAARDDTAPTLKQRSLQRRACSASMPSTIRPKKPPSRPNRQDNP